MARKGENAAAGCAIFGRMQNVIVRRRRSKPIVAVGQCLVYPGIQVGSWIGFVAAAANVLLHSFAWVAAG